MKKEKKKEKKKEEEEEEEAEEEEEKEETKKKERMKGQKKRKITASVRTCLFIQVFNGRDSPKQSTILHCVHSHFQLELYIVASELNLNG